MLKRAMFVCALALIPGAALASDVVTTGIGPRVGFSSSPDQIVFGGHLVIGEVAPSITFDPSLEVGLGDNLTILAFNFDLHYHFDTDTQWRPYAGAGATLNVVNFDESRYGNRDSDTNAGGSVMIGAGVPTQSGNRFFSELKFGLGDWSIPDLKFVVGWNFKL